MDEGQSLSRDTYVVLVARTIWENLPQMIWGGLLFSLCCLPAFTLFALGLLAPTVVVSAVTIAPAWTALLAFQRLLLSNRVAKSTTFFYALRDYGWRSASLGGVAAFPVLAALITLPRLAQEPVPRLVWVGLAADFFGMALLVVLLLYAFPLLLYTDQQVWVVLRNALSLASRHPLHTFGLLGMAVLFGFAVASLSLGLLFFLPAIYGMFVMSNTQLVLQQE